MSADGPPEPIAPASFRWFDLLISMREVERDLANQGFGNIGDVLRQYQCSIFTPDELAGLTSWPEFATAPLLGLVSTASLMALEG